MRLAANLIEHFGDLFRHMKMVEGRHEIWAVFLGTILVSRTYIDVLQCCTIGFQSRMNCLLNAYIPVVSSSSNRVELLGSGTA